jgi:hypothetical protein
MGRGIAVCLDLCQGGIKGQAAGPVTAMTALRGALQSHRVLPEGIGD